MDYLIARSELYNVRARNAPADSSIEDPSDFLRMRAEFPDLKIGCEFDHQSWAALWRSAANSAVKYENEFPPALLGMLEGIDGSIGHGEARNVHITFVWRAKDWVDVSIRDDGLGMRDLARFKAWSSAKSTDHPLHRNGHGLKMMLSKLTPDYKSAVWGINYRNRGGDLYHITAPYLGERTPVIRSENATFCMPSGTEVWAKVNPEVFGKFASPDQLFQKVKELIRSRYAQSVLSRTTFHLSVQGYDIPRAIYENSKGWLSLEERVRQKVRDGSALRIADVTVPLKEGAWARITQYYLPEKANTTDMKRLADEFHIYGKKGTEATRIHAGFADRIVESIPYHEIAGVKAHNYNNGFVFFVEFGGDVGKIPCPATIKVSFKADDDCFRIFQRKFAEMYPPGVLKAKAAEIKAALGGRGV